MQSTMVLVTEAASDLLLRLVPYSAGLLLYLDRTSKRLTIFRFHFSNIAATHRRKLQLLSMFHNSEHKSYCLPKFLLVDLQNILLCCPHLLGHHHHWTYTITGMLSKQAASGLRNISCALLLHGCISVLPEHLLFNRTQQVSLCTKISKSRNLKSLANNSKKNADCVKCSHS